MTTATMDPTELRALPHSLEAERSVLGAILLHPDCLADALEHVTPAHFFRHGHRKVFEAILALDAAKQPIDLVPVKDWLARHHALDDAGGPAYLASLVDGVPRSANVAGYAALVRQKADLRAVIQAAARMASEAYDAEDDARDVIDRAEQAIFAIGQGEQAAGFRSLGEIMPAVMTQIEAWCASRSGVSGVPSGFRDLDAMTRGFQPGNLVILAARPAMGKSALVLNIAQHVAGLGKTVGLFSLEMSETELGVRALTTDAKVSGYQLQRGWVRDGEWPRLSSAFARLSELPLYIDESPFLTAFDMRARARRLKAAHGLDLLIVDYTQLMIAHESERKENRTLELGAISRALKALAKELKVPVIALSQLSRRVEERADKRPMLSDLRESGALEQDADLVLFIFREAVYRETEQNKGLAELIIGKQRNGPIGTVKLAWIADETRFADLAEEPEDRRLPMGDR